MVFAGGFFGFFGVLGFGCAPVVDDTVANTDAGQVAATTASLDYTVGALAVAGLDDDAAVDVATVHSDAVVRTAPGGVYVVNRLLMDTVRYYPTGSGLPTWETSTEPGSNPHDAVLCGGSLFVSRYERSSLLVLDPADGVVRAEVDLSAFADDDGLPEVSDLVAVGDQLAVGLQRLRRLDGWTAEPQGQVVMVSCGDLSVGEAYDVGPNPVVRPWDDAEVMVLATDGVRFLDLATGALDGPHWAEGAVDGWPDGRGGAVLIGRQDASHAVWCVDRAGRWDRSPWVERFLSAVVAQDGEAWVATRAAWTDPNGAGGIGRWDLGRCEEVGLVGTELPPFSVALGGEVP